MAIVLLGMWILFLLVSVDERQTINRIDLNLYLASTIISKCTEKNGVVLPPEDKFDGGGKVCSLPEIDGTWRRMPRESDVKYTFLRYHQRYQYRTLNDSVISGGDESKDWVVCNIHTKTCKYLK